LISSKELIGGPTYRTVKHVSTRHVCMGSIFVDGGSYFLA
jgi:hypothetical protein